MGKNKNKDPRLLNPRRLWEEAEEAREFNQTYRFTSCMLAAGGITGA
jgi:hypothetical protein